MGGQKIKMKKHSDLPYAILVSERICIYMEDLFCIILIKTTVIQYSSVMKMLLMLS